MIEIKIKIIFDMNYLLDTMNTHVNKLNKL